MKIFYTYGQFDLIFGIFGSLVGDGASINTCFLSNKNLLSRHVSKLYNSNIFYHNYANWIMFLGP